MQKMQHNSNNIIKKIKSLHSFPVVIVSIETKTLPVRSPENITLKTLTSITNTEINHPWLTIMSVLL